MKPLLLCAVTILLSAVSVNAQFAPRDTPFKYDSNWNPAWERLVPIARSTAAQIKGGAVGPDVIRPLREAQVRLPAAVPRPIICLDMMVDAMSKRRIDPAYAIKRADEAVECYEGVRVAQGPSSGSSSEPPQPMFRSTATVPLTGSSRA